LQSDRLITRYSSEGKETEKEEGRIKL